MGYKPLHRDLFVDIDKDIPRSEALKKAIDEILADLKRQNILFELEI